MNLRYIVLSFTDVRCIRPLSLKKYCAHKLVTRSKGLQHILILLAIWPLSSRWGNWFFHYTIVVSFPLSFWLQQLYRENEKKRKEKNNFDVTVGQDTFMHSQLHTFWWVWFGWSGLEVFCFWCLAATCYLQQPQCWISQGWGMAEPWSECLKREMMRHDEMKHLYTC